MFQKRVVIIVGFIAITFFVIVVRLFALQVINNSYYRTQARKYATRIELIADPRGKILDRNGNILVTNKLAFDLFITPAIYLKPKISSGAKTISNNSASSNPGDAKVINSDVEDDSAQREIIQRLANLMKVKSDDIASKINTIQQKVITKTETKPEREKK